jgi:RNA polymerase sigma-70 factor (ECF subfamily)
MAYRQPPIRGAASVSLYPGGVLRVPRELQAAPQHSVEWERQGLKQVADDSEFERMVARHCDEVRRLAFRLLGWRGDGEDVVQEVFLAAWAAWRRYPGEDAAGLWLKRIAVNKCRSRMRRDAVGARWRAWLMATRPEEPSAAAEDSLEQEERAARVRRAIDSLPPRYREMTILYYLEQMSLEEIAQVTGRRRNTIEVQLHRARRILETALKGLVE